MSCAFAKNQPFKPFGFEASDGGIAPSDRGNVVSSVEKAATEEGLFVMRGTDC